MQEEIYRMKICSMSSQLNCEGHPGSRNNMNGRVILHVKKELEIGDLGSETPRDTGGIISD